MGRLEDMGKEKVREEKEMSKDLRKDEVGKIKR